MQTRTTTIAFKVTSLLYHNIDHRNHTSKAEPYALKHKKQSFHRFLGLDSTSVVVLYKRNGRIPTYLTSLFLYINFGAPLLEKHQLTLRMTPPVTVSFYTEVKPDLN